MSSCLLDLPNDLLRLLFNYTSAKTLYAFAFFNRKTAYICLNARYLSNQRRRLHRNHLTNASIVPYLPNGLQDGFEERWSLESYSLIRRLSWHNGKRCGLEEIWFVTGEQWGRAFWRNNTLIGDLQCWNMQGEEI